MLIKRSKYDAIVEENLSLRKKNSELDTTANNLAKICDQKITAIGNLKLVITTQENAIADFTAKNEQLSNKLHKKDQPRQGGRFYKK